MKNKILFPETISFSATLYKRTFPLKKGLTFTRYLEILDEQNFSPYTVIINKISRNKSNMKIVITDYFTMMRLGWSSGGAVGDVLFSEAIIKKSGEKAFTIEASVGTGNLITIFFYAVLSIVFFVGILYIVVIKNLPLQNALVAPLILALVLYPLMSTYFRDRNLLNIIGSLGSHGYEEFKGVKA